MREFGKFRGDVGAERADHQESQKCGDQHGRNAPKSKGAQPCHERRQSEGEQDGQRHRHQDRFAEIDAADDDGGQTRRVERSLQRPARHVR